MPRKSLRNLFASICLIGVLVITNRATVFAQEPGLLQDLAAIQAAPEPHDVSAFETIAAASTVVLYPPDDAPVREGAPNSTAANQLYLGTGYDDGSLYGSSGRVRSYLRFDLSGIPSDSTISSATLRLYHAGGQDYPGTSRTIRLYRVTGNWNESSITWNNRPGYAEAVGSISSTYNYIGWRSIDLTDLVKAWVSGSKSNYGLIAVGPESIQGVYRIFASGESAYSPELEIVYLPAPPPVLDVRPDTLSLKATNTQSPFVSSFEISNVTANSLDWTGTRVGSPTWLQLTTSSGSVTPTQPDDLVMTINPTVLPPGNYSEQIQVSSNTPGVVGSPMIVTIQLDVVDQLANVYLPIILDGDPSGSPESPNVAALILGIADYQYADPAPTSGELPDDFGTGDLSEPGHDKNDFYALLNEEFNFPADRILTNHDSTVSNPQPNIGLATYAKIVAAFATLDQMEDENTTVIVYFSGHGGQVLDQNGDESDGLDEFIATYNTNIVDNNYINIITDDELESLLAALESECIIVILDSCFSGSMMSAANLPTSELRPRGLPLLAQSAPTQTAGVDIGLAAPGRLVITAGTGDQATWESPALENGVFTYFFLNGLGDNLNDANQNGSISFEEAFWFTREGIDEWIYTRQGEHQNPDINDKCYGQVHPGGGC